MSQLPPSFSTLPGGRIKFEENGRRAGAGIMIIQWQNGRKEIVWPEEIRTARAIFGKAGP